MKVSVNPLGSLRVSGSPTSIGRLTSSIAMTPFPETQALMFSKTRPSGL